MASDLSSPPFTMPPAAGGKATSTSTPLHVLPSTQLSLDPAAFHRQQPGAATLTDASALLPVACSPNAHITVPTAADKLSGGGSQSGAGEGADNARSSPADSQQRYHQHTSADTNPRPSGTGESLNLFVANLSADVTDEMLEQAFSPFGQLLAVKVMLHIHTGVSRGFGFVLFADRDAGARAMAALHSTVIGGKQVFVSVAKTTGRGGMQLTPKLYVRNVPRVVPIETLKDFFAQFGELVRITFRGDGTQASAPPSQRAYLETTTVVFLEYRTVEMANEAVRRCHNSRPWPDMQVPLLAKPAETSELRNERRHRQLHKDGPVALVNTGGAPEPAHYGGHQQLPTAAFAPRLEPTPPPPQVSVHPQYFGPANLGQGAPPVLHQSPPGYGYAQAGGVPLYLMSPGNIAPANHGMAALPAGAYLPQYQQQQGASPPGGFAYAGAPPAVPSGMMPSVLPHGGPGTVVGGGSFALGHYPVQPQPSHQQQSQQQQHATFFALPTGGHQPHQYPVQGQGHTFAQ